MKALKTNDLVTTPLGDGVCQGHYAILGADGQPVEHCALVRIPITEENLHLLGSTKCMTPRAMGSALFVFSESEVSHVQ